MSKRMVLLGLLAFFLEIGISFHLFSGPNGQNEPLLFVPAPEYVKCLTGTFRPLAAQMLFMKGVLEGATNTSKKMEYLFAIFRASLQLSPELHRAAFFGGVVLPQKPADIPKGIELIEEARRLNPSEWRYPYWIGFNYSQLEDYKNAAKYYEQASLLPGSPDFLKTNLAWLHYNAHSPDLALAYFRGLQESVNDEDTMATIHTKILWLENIVVLELKVNEFKKTHGRWPEQLSELVEKGLVKEVPKDPFGGGYYLDKITENGSEKCLVRSRF